MRILAVLGALTVLLAVGCARGTDASSTSPTPTPTHRALQTDPLAGTAWELDALIAADGSTWAPVVDSHVSFGDDGRVEGRGACNDMAGTYEVVGETLDIGVQQLTDIACSGEEGEQETHVFGVLEGEPIWELGEATLVLTVADGRGLRYTPRDEDASDGANVTTSRLDGATRFETAASIATATYEEAGTAVLASGRQYPDALVASYPAGIVGGPVLLVQPESVPEATKDALAGLGVGSVVLVGGPAVVSDEVEASLVDDGYEVARHHGDSRYATAAAVATTFAGSGSIGTVDGDRTALLASGATFSDAASVGPLAAGSGLPLLLTPPDEPHEAVTAALGELDIERIIVVGGANAVSRDVVDFYADRGHVVERIAGSDRTETAVRIARAASERFSGFATGRLLLARGDDFPDVLAASSHGAALGAPVLLTETPSVLSTSTADYLAELCPQVELIRVLGGSAAVQPQTVEDAVAAAAACADER